MVSVYQTPLCPEEKMKKDYIPRSFNMATYPLRYQYAAKVITRAVELFDIVRVCYNNYDKIPDYIDDLRKKYKGKVEIVAVIPEEDLKDTGKFLWSGNSRKEYYFSGDDDILPTKAYIKKHIEELEKYNGRVVVSFLGYVFHKESYDLSHRIKNANCLVDNPSQFWGHVGGTGVMVIDLQHVTFDITPINIHGIVDITAAHHFKNGNIPISIRSHDKKEVEYILPDTFVHTLWKNKAFYLPPVRKMIRELSMEDPLVGTPVVEEKKS